MGKMTSRLPGWRVGSPSAAPKNTERQDASHSVTHLVGGYTYPTPLMVVNNDG